MAYKVIILYRLYMPSYFLGTFTEYPYLTSLQTFCSSTIGFKSLFKFSFNTEAKGRGAALTGYASPNTIYTFFPLSYQMPSDLRTASTFFSASASALV